MSAQGSGSPFAPLRSSKAFRLLLSASTISMFGTWMQTVGAQWFLVSRAPDLVALVQTATFLPALIFGLFAGALADIFDRRLIVLAAQLVQGSVVGALAVLALTDRLTPLVLLAMLLVLGSATVMSGPAWLAVQTEVVPRQDLVQAATLVAAATNIGRAIGPAIGGGVVAATGPAGVFGLNALSYLAAFGLLAASGIPRGRSGDPEPFLPAVRAGARYMRFSALARRVLFWTIFFTAVNCALWALLPVIAAGRLHLDAVGYGLLLGMIGVGAVCGALLMPCLQRRSNNNVVFASAVLVSGISIIVLAIAPHPIIAAAALLPTGVAYIVVIGLLNSTIQLALPVWVRSRGLSIFMTIFMGSLAVGSALWAAVSYLIGASWALLASGALLVAGVVLLRLLPFPVSPGAPDVDGIAWQRPVLAISVSAQKQAVIVQVRYRSAPDEQTEFLYWMSALARSRRRTGALRHQLLQDGTDPDLFIEIYVMGAWADYLRQQETRRTTADRQIECRVRVHAEVIEQTYWFAPNEPAE